MVSPFDFSKEKFLIFGDLHANSRAFATSCEEAGADALIFHLNQDSSDGARFGGLEIEEESIKEALSVVKIPVGISLGDSRVLLMDEWESIVNLGFSFVNMFAHHFPTFVWQDPRISKLVSIGPGYILEQVKALSEFDTISGLVGALTPRQGHGLPMTLLDVTTLGLITKLSSKPVYVPTQRNIRIEDVEILKKQGCSGILVTNNSYGETVESCKEQISKFEQAATATTMNTQSFTSVP